MGLTDKLLADDQKRRVETRPHPKTSKPKNGSVGGGRNASRKGKRWSVTGMIRSWIGLGRWALAKRSAQLYVALLAKANPKTRIFNGGRAELAQACGCEDSTITRMLETLERLDMIKRRQHTRTVNGSISSSISVWILDPPEPGDQAKTTSLPGMQ